MEIVRPTESGQAYICPMHADARQFGPGKCPTCSMALVPESTRFPFLRHMVSSPRHLLAMLGLMLLLIAAVMIAADGAMT